jgi:hypothetical protein
MNAGQRLGLGAAAVVAAGALARWPAPLAAQTAPTPSRPPAESPDLAGLRSAFLSGAPDELVRAGQRLPAARLGDVLAGSDREMVLAATGAAPSAPDAIWLLVPLGELASSPDRPLAAAAARSAARIAGQLDADELLDRDVPPDWTRARLAEYRARAADAGRWTDVRVACLEVAAQLQRSLGERAAGAPYDMAALLADPEPEVRRAAVELALGPLGAREIELVAGRVSSDDDGGVRAAAAQALCEGLAFGDAPQPVLAALGSRGLARLRALVADSGQPESARAAASLCLVADGSTASRAVLERSSQGSDEVAPAADSDDDDKARDTSGARSAGDKEGDRDKDKEEGERASGDRARKRDKDKEDDKAPGDRASGDRARKRDNDRDGDKAARDRASKASKEDDKARDRPARPSKDRATRNSRRDRKEDR